MCAKRNHRVFCRTHRVCPKTQCGSVSFLQGPLNGGVKRGGFLIWTVLSFFVLFWVPQKPIKGKNTAESSRECLEKTLGKPVPNHEVQVNFSELFSFYRLLCLLTFLGLSRFFWDFPDLLGDGPGIFPICPFPLSQPIKSPYEEQSRKGPRHNLDLSRKRWETPGFGNTPV